MKHTIMAGLLAGFFSAMGQPVEFKYKPTTSLSESIVSIENLFADISIVGTNESEIRIEADDYDGMPEKASGLKPLSATGPENTGIGLYVNQEGNVVTIGGAHREADDAEYVVYLPKSMMLKVNYSSFRAGDVTIEGMANEVEVKSQVGDLVFENVTGPIVANTLSADIDIRFSELSQRSPTSLTSTSGDIDVTLPADTKGSFKLSSTSGEVYTDMDFEFEGEESLRRYGGGMSAKATLNGGGVIVTIRCVSGDVFIRKGS